MKFMHAVAVAATLSTSAVMAQEVRGSASATVAGKSVAVEYGRPVLAGRDMLGLAKVGSPWRMGAGSPTSLTTDADLGFGDVAIPKGSYILTAMKDEKGTWSVIASSSTSQVKVAEIPLTSTTLQESVEQFTIELTGDGDGGEFAMMWGKARMAAPFKAK